MREEDEKQIQQLMSQTDCDNDFRCYKTGFKKLCNGKIIGDGRLIDCTDCHCDGCLRTNPKECPHRRPYGFGHFCHCPLRLYAAQHFVWWLKKTLIYSSGNLPGVVQNREGTATLMQEETKTGNDNPITAKTGDKLGLASVCFAIISTAFFCVVP